MTLEIKVKLKVKGVFIFTKTKLSWESRDFKTLLQFASTNRKHQCIQHSAVRLGYLSIF